MCTSIYGTCDVIIRFVLIPVPTWLYKSFTFGTRISGILFLCDGILQNNPFLEECECVAPVGGLPVFFLYTAVKGIEFSLWSSNDLIRDKFIQLVYI